MLGKEVFARVFVSPLQRARETCELAGLGNSAVTDAGLVEWNYGRYEGLTPKQIHEGAPGWLIFRDVYRRFEPPAPKRELVLAWRRSLPRGDACRNWRADCAARSLRTRS